jgi:hypothetical protein
VSIHPDAVAAFVAYQELTKNSQRLLDAIDQTMAVAARRLRPDHLS